MVLYFEAIVNSSCTFLQKRKRKKKENDGIDENGREVSLTSAMIERL